MAEFPHAVSAERFFGTGAACSAMRAPASNRLRAFGRSGALASPR
jgi:hypothetical protein